MTDTMTLPGINAPDDVATARVIGIDLSLTGTGMSDGQTTWLIRSTGKADDALARRWNRLQKIARDVCARIPTDTALVLIEAPAFSKTQGHAHDRSGLWWLIVNSLHAANIAVTEATPQAVKLYATGKGNAGKHDVIDATARRCPDVDTGADDNRCDAHWLALIALDHLTGVHIVPDLHRRALDKIRWPDLEQGTR